MEENQNYQKSNKKTKMLSILGIIALVLLLGGMTYAFFNYTRTGGSNTIRVGRIYFNTNQNGTINLNNLFPIDPTDSTAMNDPTKVGTIEIEIEGDTDYSEGVEYVISSVESNITANGKTIPISLDITVSNGLGTSNANYFTARESTNASIYKKIVGNTLEGDEMLLVGYIVPNTTSGTIEGIDGSITIKAYLDKNNILISDTYDGTESDNMGTPNSMAQGKTVFTTSEWNSLTGNNAISFKIKVEANEEIWVKEPLTLVEEITRKVSTANYIASYADVIAEAQTQNLTFTTQDQVSTSATKQTVYYYTGNSAAANSNVLFAGYCWQIIRTTDNGGIKLIYNGVASNNKCETTRSATKGINGGIGGSITSLTSATLFGRSYDYNLETGQFTLQDSTGLPTAWNNTNYPELIGTYTCLSNSSTCTTLYYVGSYYNSTSAYVASYTIGDVAHYSQIGTSVFNAYFGSPALVGYMFNKEYDYKSGSKSGEYYTNAVWNGSTYVLSAGNSGTEPDATHHYICDSDCTKVRYYFYSMYYYILLENGKIVEDALKEMINYKTNANDTDENINVYNSAIKGYLDNWYKKNLTAYASYLDNDTVFCNDRGVGDLGGWNPSGTNINGNFAFNQYGVDKDLSCVNETDRFSKSNNKAKLDYPIGLLTESERKLMTANYVQTGQEYWSLSPNSITGGNAVGLGIGSTGDNYSYLVYYNYSVRGVITLKPGTKFADGTGTYTDPYVVGPIVERSN